MSIQSRPRYASLLIGLALLSMGSVHAQTDITASVTITRPAASCAVSGTQDLTFGTFTLGSSTGSATSTPTATAANRFSGSPSASWGGSEQWGTFAVAVSNTSTATSISISYPSNIETSGCSDANCRIAFSSGAVANGATSTAPTFASGAPNLAGTGLGNTTNRYYRLGGSLSGITTAKTTGTYEGDITVTVTCGT